MISSGINIVSIVKLLSLAQTSLPSFALLFLTTDCGRQLQSLLSRAALDLGAKLKLALFGGAFPAREQSESLSHVLSLLSVYRNVLELLTYTLILKGRLCLF